MHIHQSWVMLCTQVRMVESCMFITGGSLGGWVVGVSLIIRSQTSAWPSVLAFSCKVRRYELTDRPTDRLTDWLTDWRPLAVWLAY